MRLSDGHPVGIHVAGRGVPFVVVHGFTAQGVIYAQTLSRLVSMGFKVITIDTPGHGGTPLPRHRLCRLADLDLYTATVHEVVDQLGIREAVFLGHSFGGRLVTDLAASCPERVIALILVDAIVGAPWDDQAARLRRCPVLGAGVLGRLMVDLAATIPAMSDPVQSLKLASLVIGAGWGRRPLRLLGPGLGILLARPSAPVLDRLAEKGVPAVVIHGSSDITVPVAAGRDAANRLGATLALVEDGSHAWLLRDPETLPAIIGHLLAGVLGDAWSAALLRAGLDPARATTSDVESVLYEPDALALRLTPPLIFARPSRPRRPARYRWEVVPA